MERPNEHDVRVLLEESGIDVTAPKWEEPGFVIADHVRYEPSDVRGYLFVNGEPRYSAAWI